MEGLNAAATGLVFSRTSLLHDGAVLNQDRNPCLRACYRVGDEQQDKAGYGGGAKENHQPRSLLPASDSSSFSSEVAGLCQSLHPKMGLVVGYLPQQADFKQGRGYERGLVLNFRYWVKLVSLVGTKNLAPEPRIRAAVFWGWGDGWNRKAICLGGSVEMG